MGVLQLIWLCEIMRGMLLMCQNITMRAYGARIKRYCVLCSKHIAVWIVFVITSCCFATSRLVAPVSVRLVYWVGYKHITGPRTQASSTLWVILFILFITALVPSKQTVFLWIQLRDDSMFDKSSYCGIFWRPKDIKLDDEIPILF